MAELTPISAPGSFQISSNLTIMSPGQHVFEAPSQNLLEHMEEEEVEYLGTIRTVSDDEVESKEDDDGYFEVVNISEIIRTLSHVNIANDNGLCKCQVCGLTEEKSPGNVNIAWRGRAVGFCSDCWHRYSYSRTRTELLQFLHPMCYVFFTDEGEREAFKHYILTTIDHNFYCNHWVCKFCNLSKRWGFNFNLKMACSNCNKTKDLCTLCATHPDQYNVRSPNSEPEWKCADCKVSNV
jgi:hypothetical protein